VPDITSANSVLILTTPLLLPVPTQIQGFSADDIFTTAPVVPVQTKMGLDGNLSAGYVPTEKKMEIVLMAGSASNEYFDAIQAGQDALLQALQIFGSLTLPSIGRFFTLTNGYLTRFPPTADGRQTLQPRRFEITFENIVGIPVSAAG
jgi:hypothetical protein